MVTKRNLSTENIILHLQEIYRTLKRLFKVLLVLLTVQQRCGGGPAPGTPVNEGRQVSIHVEEVIREKRGKGK